tara:strand:+ start:547 stop:1428 length:882 start_codon:yes stop_codon:yes gene_type:complete
MKVVYGHTDSIYVQIDSVETAEIAIKEIEASVREHFPNVMGLDEHPVQLEFEKYFSALGVGTTKNRNAGLVSWEDGEWLDKPKFTMTGFTAKRVSETKLAKSVQTEVLTMWVNQCSLHEINKYLHSIYCNVREGKLEPSEVIKRSRLRANRFTVKCPECKTKYSIRENFKWCGKCGKDSKYFTTLEGKKPTFGSGIAGILYGWQKKNMEFDDSYLFVKVKHVNDSFRNPLTHEMKQVEYVSGTTYADFDGYLIDWDHYAQEVVRKAEPIYKAMDWDISSIRTGKIQKKLDDWW